MVVIKSVGIRQCGDCEYLEFITGRSRVLWDLFNTFIDTRHGKPAD